jgi:esterase
VARLLEDHGVAAVDRYALIGGIRLHYRETGIPSGPWTWVVHGIMGHSWEWDTLLAALAGDFRTVAVDQRGHGASGWGADYSAATLADDLAQLVRRVHAAPVRLIGHSLGGMAAMLVAAQRPDLVERLVVIDVGPESLSGDFGAVGLPAMLAAMAQATYSDPDEALQEWLVGDPFAREPLLRHYVEHCLVPRADGRFVWRFDGAGLARQAAAGITSEQQLWGAVDRIAAPTLLVRGEQSPLLSRESAERVVRRLAQGRLVEIPAGAHDLGVQQPEAVAAGILEFLRT